MDIYFSGLVVLTDAGHSDTSGILYLPTDVEYDFYVNISQSLSIIVELGQANNDPTLNLHADYSSSSTAIYSGPNIANRTYLGYIIYTISESGEIISLVSTSKWLSLGSLEISGGAAGDTFYGTGNDTLRGNGGNDTIYSGGGADIIEGGAGDDSLEGGSGSHIDGGIGNDIAKITLTTSSVNYTFDAAAVLAGESDLGDGTRLANIENVYLETGSGDDTFILSNPSGLIGGYNWTVGGGTNHLVVNFDTTDESVVANYGFYTYYVAVGDRRILSTDRYGPGLFSLSGGSGNDYLAGGGLNDTLRGNGGNDTIYSGGGVDIIEGGAGDDSLEGGSGSHIDGGSGNDIAKITLTTSSVNFTFDAAAVLAGESDLGDGTRLSNIENVYLETGSGDDTFILSNPSGLIGGYNWTVGGGTNHLVVNFDTTDESVVANYGFYTYYVAVGDRRILSTDRYGPGLFSLSGGSGNDYLVGGGLNDTLRGNGGNDTLTGEGGHDRIEGGDGNNILNGGFGHDYLKGGNDFDLLTGGPGRDLFVFTPGDDIFTDFTFTEDMLFIDPKYGPIQAGVDPNQGFYIEVGTGPEAQRVWLPNVPTSPPQTVLIVRSPVLNLVEGTDQDDILQGADNSDVIFGRSGHDSLYGLSSQDFLYGGSGNDLLDGGLGADFIFGGAGNDTYIVDNVLDFVGESGDEGIDSVLSSVSLGLGDDVEVLILTGIEDLTGTGNGRDNVITGNSGRNFLSGLAGDDQLDGAAGADTMIGDLGDDTFFVDNAGDAVEELSDQGTDIVESTVTYTLSANVENLTLTGSLDVNGTGNGSGNALRGNSGLNILSGLGGDDTYYLDQVGDKIVEQVNQGVDAVVTIVAYTLGANIENLTLTGFGSINGTGNGLNNVLTGNAGVNILTGLGGNDTYYVQDTGDLVVEAIGQGTDIVYATVSHILGQAVENLVLQGAANLTATGNLAANSLTGNSGSNLLDGGAGNDTMAGGLGDDSFVVNADGDVVTELADQGTDTILSARTFTLGSNIENLVLTGTGANTGTGNALNNALTGNDAVNWLDGGAGNDTLAGGLSNDTYVVDAAGDVTSEAEGAGTDTVRSSVSWTLAANTEILLLTGTGANNGTGNALNNILTGNSAVNTLSGGLGNDTYNVQNTTDTVAEGVGEGTDAVLSNVTFTLGANVENLTLIGNNHVNATGNSGNNVLIGNVGNNILTGGLGDDTYYIQNVNDFVVEQHWEGTDTVYTTVAYSLFGRAIENLFLMGTDNLNAVGNSLANALTGNSGNNVLSGANGNDTYYVQNAGDSVIENANEGIDTVVTTVTWTLGDNTENATLTGNQHFNLTGNGLNNVLTGNIGNNILTGGLGDDTYYVQNVNDFVVEQHFQGTDVIYSTVTYSLFGRAVENLILQGTENLNATGNSLNNVLTGNAGANRLEAGVGNDTHSGGLGADVFVFLAASGKDTISDFSGSQNDTINVNAYTAGVANNAMISQSGANVLINLGGGNTVTVLNASQADVLSHMVW